jgi:hypothetical protein
MMKGWIIMMGWVGLCSTSLVFASNSEHSSKIAEHSDSDEKSEYWVILHKALIGEDENNKNSVDLSSLHLLQMDDDFATGKGIYAKWHRNDLRVLCDYLFDVPDEEYFAEDLYQLEKYSKEEKFWKKKDSQKEEDKEEDSDPDWGKLFPIAKLLKARFTSEELLQMNIDLRRLLEIEYLCTLAISRPYTPEEESLLDEAIGALFDRFKAALSERVRAAPPDHSPENHLLIAIRSAAEDPEKALEEVKLIIETENVDVNSLYKGPFLKRLSFLHRAAVIGQNRGLEIVRFLLDNGANINLLDAAGTALLGAVWKGNIEVVRLLIDRKADVNLKVSNGWCPLHEASFFGFPDIVELLLDAGANPDFQDEGSL